MTAGQCFIRVKVSDVSILFIEVFFLWRWLLCWKAFRINWFQSSLLRCSFCDAKKNGNPVTVILPDVSILFIEVFFLWLPRMGGSWFVSNPAFQSSLLRCSFCDQFIESQGWQYDGEVSILFIEVFFLWRNGRTFEIWEHREFQSSLLRCSFCDKLF